MTDSRDFLTDSILPTGTTENTWIQTENGNLKGTHCSSVSLSDILVFLPIGNNVLVFLKYKKTMTYESESVKLRW